MLNLPACLPARSKHDIVYNRKVNIFFVVPGLSERYRTGGLLVLQNLAKLFAEIPYTECRFIATHEQHQHDVLSFYEFSKNLKTYNLQPIFIVSWGPLVSQHIKLIRKYAPHARILYYAQSFGWGVKVPPDIPIVCVSNYVAEKWRLTNALPPGRPAKNILAVIPPPLNPVFCFGEGPRDIDILIHTRKQNEYCLKQLVPRLEGSGERPPALRRPGGGAKASIKIIETWIPQNEFAELLKRAKLFLYITAPHTHGRIFKKTFAEGFGLPALEALACGALVGSNLLGGVRDFLKPGQNCIELGTGPAGSMLEKDLAKIFEALQNFRPNRTAAEKIAAQFAQNTIQEKWKAILSL